MNGIRQDWQRQEGNVKKTAITAVVVLLAVFWLIGLPHIELPGRTHSPEGGAVPPHGKPSPAVPAAAKTEAQPALPLGSGRVAPNLDPVVIPPPVDPWAAWFGLYEGSVNVPQRGLCKLNFVLAPVDGRAGTYSGASELACVDTIDVFKHAGKAGPLAPALTLNPTRARFEGTPQDGALVFQAADNIIQPGTFKACEMVSVSVRPFVEGHLSAKWKEKQTESGICAGGELILEKR
jgi:hypothetical protein